MEQCSSSDSCNYMINNEIIFNPEMRILYRVNDETNVQTLNAPTTKFFLLLISRPGIVDQATIYSYVWGENESMITPNNLYQNISLIRRALSKLSPGLSLIKTIPRIGFTIDTDIEIEKVSSEMKWPQRNEKDGNEARNEKRLGLNEVPKKNIKKTLLYPQGIMLLLMLSAIASIIFVSNTLRQPPYFLNYKAFFNKGGCNIYTSMATKRDIKFITDELMKKCETTPWNYVSYSSSFSDISVISCKRSLDDNEKNDCKSTYFFMKDGV